MKNLLLYLSLFFLPAGLMAQENNLPNQFSGFSSVNDAAVSARAIVKASGKELNFAIAEAPIPNAAAVLYQGKRFVFYNPRFMDSLNKKTGNRWSAISVLAHEIGHHLNGTNRPNGQPGMATELQADEFSGFVLEKMGASLTDAQAAISTLSQVQASRTHPGKDDRIMAIATGWKNANVLANDPEDQAEVTVNQKATIASVIYFEANPQGKYYVTSDGGVITVKDGAVFKLGQLRSFDNENYPYMIEGDRSYKLYVHHTGAIVNREGKYVGTVKAITSSDAG